MQEGMKTLEGIEHVLHSIRKEIERIDQELELLFSRSQENSKEQTKVLDALAKIYFLQIEKKDVTVKNEDSFSSEIAQMIAKRAQRYQKLLTEIEQQQHRLASLEDQRAQKHTLLDNAAKEVIKAEHHIQTLLEEDKAYQTQLKVTRERKKIAEEAEKKALEAEQRRYEKGKPYEEDALFSYLWRVKYGTSEYQGSRLVKMLDSWVASLISYEKYRVNYWTLLEIPKRLRLHADEEKEAYMHKLGLLSQIEHTYAKRVELSKLQAKEKEQQEAVDAVDDEIVETEEKLKFLIEQRQSYLEDKDSAADQIISQINQILLKMQLSELERVAHETAEKEDDNLVWKLKELKASATKIQNTIKMYRKLYDSKITQMHEVEVLRDKFKKSRYDDIRSGFENDRVIKEMLGGLLGGLVHSSVLWDTLQQNQRHMDTGAWPDFGSGGFSGGNGSPWHFPKSRDGESMFQLPDFGGFSSRNRVDDFSTGGGF